MALDLECPASSPTLFASNAERAGKSMGGAFVVRTRKSPFRRGRFPEGSLKESQVRGSGRPDSQGPGRHESDERPRGRRTPRGEWGTQYPLRHTRRASRNGWTPREAGSFSRLWLRKGLTGRVLETPKDQTLRRDQRGALERLRGNAVPAEFRCSLGSLWLAGSTTELGSCEARADPLPSWRKS
jgi:hypothetical protein